MKRRICILLVALSFLLLPGVSVLAVEIQGSDQKNTSLVQPIEGSWITSTGTVLYDGPRPPDEPK